MDYVVWRSYKCEKLHKREKVAKRKNGEKEEKLREEAKGWIPTGKFVERSPIQGKGGVRIL